MPREKDPTKDAQAPRTDLPPAREPYYRGYFGTGEEEGIEREREAPDLEAPRGRGREDEP